MKFVKGAVAALLLSLVGVDAGKASLGAQSRKAFMKAMEAHEPPSVRAAHRNEMLANVLSKAKHVGGRKLNDNQDDDYSIQQQYEEYGFVIGQYSIKYIGCQAILQFSDDLAADEDVTTVLSKSRFVIFRLCPTESCNMYSSTGCGSDYGEYAVPLVDYMAIMAQYNVDNQERYCEYCQGCVERAAEEAENENDDQRRLNDAEEAAKCDGDMEEDCYNAVYGDACAYADDDGNQAVDVGDYLECVGVNDANGNQYYIGPVCSGDSYAITLDVFTEETCTTFADDGTQFADITGISLSSDDMAGFIPQECISCQGNQWVMEEEGQEEENDDANAEAEAEVAEICEYLHGSSAKCHANLNNYGTYYNMDYTAGYSEMTCDFITALGSGNYNQNGEIVLDNSLLHFNISNWKDKEEYIKEFQEIKTLSSRNGVTGGQIAGLVITSVACLFMWVWACCLHGSLNKKKIGWRPRRGGKEVNDISRQNSGIVMGRSNEALI